MKMRHLALCLAGALQLYASNAANAQDDAGPTGPLDIGNFSTTIYGTTQYMFRGITNSDGPAIQASIDWAYSGFYLGIWGSNTEFSDSDIEIDGYGGYRWSWFGWGFDVSGLYYWFPGEDDEKTDDAGDSALDPGFGAFVGGQEADYIEAQLLVSRSFDMAWSPGVSFKYNFSPDTFGEDGNAHNFQGDAGVIVPLGFLGDVGFSATVGYVNTEGDHSSSTIESPALGLFEPDGSPLDGFDYVWWRAGVYKDIAGFKVDISYHATDESEDLETFFPRTAEPGDFRDLIEPHVVLTVSRSFSFP